MGNAALLYQYLEEYSEESLMAFDDLMDQAESENLFCGKDIPALCEVLLNIEKNLEDETSYNIQWSSKDRITEWIVMLALKESRPEYFEAIAKMMDQYCKISRPYMESVFDTFLAVFLLGSPEQDEHEIKQNRRLFLNALKQYTGEYTTIVGKFCEDGFNELKEAEKTGAAIPEVEEQKQILSKIYHEIQSEAGY